MSIFRDIPTEVLVEYILSHLYSKDIKIVLEDDTIRKNVCKTYPRFIYRVITDTENIGMSYHDLKNIIVNNCSVKEQVICFSKYIGCSSCEEMIDLLNKLTFTENEWNIIFRNFLNYHWSNVCIDLCFWMLENETYRIHLTSEDLKIAIKTGNLEFVKSMLFTFTNPVAYSHVIITESAKYGHLHILKYLQYPYIYGPDLEMDEFNLRALCEAIKHDHIHIVEYLLPKILSDKTIDNQITLKSRLVETAASIGNFQIMELLLSDHRIEMSNLYIKSSFAEVWRKRIYSSIRCYLLNRPKGIFTINTINGSFRKRRSGVFHLLMQSNNANDKTFLKELCLRHPSVHQDFVRTLSYS